MGLAAARLGARLIAADLARSRHRCRLPAARGRAGCRRRSGDRRPRLWHRTRQGGCHRRRGRCRAHGEGGVLPVLKHIPGHGRATADSHKKLPVVSTDRATLEATDFAAFRPLAALPIGMTAHVVFTAIDPVAPATTSVTIVRDVIRDFIGFRGLLMSDDISMGALSGSLGERTRAALAAGCDVVLHCNGKMPEMREVAANAPLLAGEAARRAEAALAAPQAAAPFDLAAARRILQTHCRRLRRHRERHERRRRVRSRTSGARHRRAGAGGRCRGLRGAARPLLTLARQQKVDLAKISILALADQYLAFIEAARKMRLELAADYLVMAAWLAYLKSRLLLPELHPAEGLSAEDMANALAQRLRRLEAIRQVAEQLLNRPQLGRDVFQRGQPEPIAEIKHPQWSATLYDLLSAYAGRRQMKARSFVRVPKRTVWSLAEAREALERLMGQSMDWSPLDQYLITYLVDPAMQGDGACFELCRGARTDPRRPHGSTPARIFYPALSAQAARYGRRRVCGIGECVRGRPDLCRMSRRCA